MGQVALTVGHASLVLTLMFAAPRHRSSISARQRLVAYSLQPLWAEMKSIGSARFSNGWASRYLLLLQTLRPTQRATSTSALPSHCGKVAATSLRRPGAPSAVVLPEASRLAPAKVPPVVAAYAVLSRS